MIRGFIPALIVTFFIAIFILVMQTLWLYIDDIAGKGVGIFLLIELIAYMAVSFVPMALPIAVLISSVMMLGSLAERYELSSFKSAGVSLLRVMLPLMVFTVLIGLVSFFSANNIIPVANLKFKSRLYDIRKQKPALNLEEGVFNDDFEGYSIRIDKKNADNRHIQGVLIYDETEAGNDKLTIITADRGEMYMTDNQRYFILHLFDGHQYSEIKPGKKNKNASPYTRVKFREWTKVFDLSEFDMNRTDERLFKSHRTMLSVRQLRAAIDSMDMKKERFLQKFTDNNDGFYTFYKKKRDEKNTPVKHEVIEEKNKKTGKKKTVKPKEKPVKPMKKLAKPTKKTVKPKKKPVRHKIIKQVTSVDSVKTKRFLDLFASDRKFYLRDKALSNIRRLVSQSKSTKSSLTSLRDRQLRHIYIMHQKFTFAVACIVFLFIGAPMGAIVRKGGFGYPILIAILFFVLYIIMNTYFKNRTEGYFMSPELAAWYPNIILMVIGIFLTYKAMNDSKIFNIDAMTVFINKILKLDH